MTQQWNMSERYDLGGAYFDILQHETCKRLLNVYTNMARRLFSVTITAL